jgi:hypothetical protein
LNEIKKQAKNSGKGHNEKLEIANPVVHTRIATDVIREHVPENAGT